ncbi:MAG: hypothetical protein AAF518_17605 [Spirochaetota bacterium]
MKLKQDSTLYKYMHEYNHEYFLYKEEWNEHYQNLRETIKNNLNNVCDFALVGCGSLVEELDNEIVSKTDSVTLIDIIDDFLLHAKRKLSHGNVHTLNFDITLGLAEEFSQSLWEAVKSSDPAFFISSLKPELRFIHREEQFDFIVQSMVLNFFAYPSYVGVIEYIEKESMDSALVVKVQKAMLAFNHVAAQIAMAVMYSLCKKNGTLVVFTDIERIPERSASSFSTQTIYFPKPIKWYVEGAGFQVIGQKTTEWKDAPAGPNKHKHVVQHIVAKKSGTILS